MFVYLLVVGLATNRCQRVAVGFVKEKKLTCGLSENSVCLPPKRIAKADTWYRDCFGLQLNNTNFKYAFGASQSDYHRI